MKVAIGQIAKLALLVRNRSETPARQTIWLCSSESNLETYANTQSDRGRSSQCAKIASAPMFRAQHELERLQSRRPHRVHDSAAEEEPAPQHGMEVPSAKPS